LTLTASILKMIMIIMELIRSTARIGRFRGSKFRGRTDMNDVSKTASLLALAIGLAWSGESSQAQTANDTEQAQVPSTPVGQAPDGALGEIVVTAQRRAENLQNVPVAITAVSGETLEASGVRDVLDLKIALPSLNFTTTAGGYVLPVLRGIGSPAAGPGLENSVATYVDGVYIGAQSSSLYTLIDVAQVAVLKGPQGTLFGRNATGGLIQITTREPSEDFTADLLASYGNYDTVGGKAYVSGGLGTGLSASIAAVYEKRNDGTGRNLFTGREVQTYENFATRAKLLWKVGDTRVTLSGDYTNIQAADPAYRLAGLSFLGTRAIGGPYDVNNNIEGALKTEQGGGSVKIDHDFGGVTLQSITAYRASQLGTIFDSDRTPSNTQYSEINQRDRQFTQEIQLLSDTPGSPFKWVFGLYYMNGNSAYNPLFTRGSTIGGGAGAIVLRTEQLLDSYSAFGQASYEIGDRTNITAGIRYTFDKRKITATQTLDVGTTSTPNVTPVDEKISFNDPSWRISVDHRFSDQILAYLSYNRGFKSGSFVPQSFPAQILRPEVVDAFEVGLKTDLFGRRLRVNVAGFYYDYSGIQVNQIITGRQFAFSGEKTEFYGVDADITAQITPELQIFGGFSVLEATYKEFPNGVVTIPRATGGNTVIFADNPATPQRDNSVTGKTVQNAPKFTLNIGATYEIPTGIGLFRLAGDFYYNDGFFTTIDNRLRLPSYKLVNASITWKSTNERFDVQVWARNLTNEQYFNQFTPGTFADSGARAAPRTYGITAGVHF
jgi:iron complex outermembrane recepter protein